MRILENTFLIVRYSLLLLLIVPTLAMARTLDQPQIDSLENALKQKLADTTRIKTLVELSKQYQYVDYGKSKAYAEEALRIAEEKNLTKGKIIAYQNVGLVYTAGGDYSTALKYDNLALSNSLSLKDSAELTKGYNNIANDYHDLGEYDEAYFYFKESFRIAKALGDSFRMTVALHNVGRVFKELGQYDQALEHLELSKKMSEEIDDFVGIAYSYDELGDVYLRKGHYDSALALLRNSLRITRKYEEHALEPRSLIRIAQIYSYKNDFEHALQVYDSARQLHEKTNNKYGIAEVELGRGSVFLKQKQYDRALIDINNSLSIARSLNARILEIRCYYQLSELWEIKGDFKKSLANYKQYKALEDSLFSQDMQSKLLRDQVRFETEAKDSRIAELSALNELRDDQIKREELNRNILVVVVALAAIVLITVYRSGQRRRQINMLLMQHQEDMEKRSDELERLNQVKDKFFSIISHDLRSPINALAGILDLMSKDAVKPEDFKHHTQELRSRFNHTRTLLNNLLDWTLLQMDKLNLQAAKIDLHKIVDENIQLLGSIKDKKIDLINNIPNTAIGFADSNTINLVIRNLMTNAIKFTNDGGKVEIAAEERGSEWLMSVRDNGIGIKPDVLKILFDKTAPYTTRGTANEKGTGLGLILCKEFVEKNGGKIWVESAENQGSTFWFTIPKG
jgi:signal transduction histidine kinase